MLLGIEEALATRGFVAPVMQVYSAKSSILIKMKMAIGSIYKLAGRNPDRNSLELLDRKTKTGCSHKRSGWHKLSSILDSK